MHNADLMNGIVNIKEINSHCISVRGSLAVNGHCEDLQPVFLQWS